MRHMMYCATRRSDESMMRCGNSLWPGFESRLLVVRAALPNFHHHSSSRLTTTKVQQVSLVRSMARRQLRRAAVRRG